jgi:hypothetical protein
MKVVLSRKGFDSHAGGCASPILPDGRLLSLPIPEEGSGVSYGDLRLETDMSYFDLMALLIPLCRSGRVTCTLGRSTVGRSTECHLDPDLVRTVRQRGNGWKGAFGQIGAAQRHLENQGVEKDDLFLFFGWFRFTEQYDTRLRFSRHCKNGMHVIFGYLQIGEILRIGVGSPVPAWLQGHPHLAPHRITSVSNSIYLARDRLSWNHRLPGYGVFRYDDSLLLTGEGFSRSRWCLPDCFRKVDISYHKPRSFRQGYFQSACRGQEFVVRGSEKVWRWAQELLENLDEKLWGDGGECSQPSGKKIRENGADP